MKRACRFFLLFACVFYTLQVDAQCTGDNIIKYVNSDSTIQQEVRNTFKPRRLCRASVINVDTSLTYLDNRYSTFKDTLVKSGYSRKKVDSLSKVFWKLPDSLYNDAPIFCRQQFISNENNYNENKNNLILLISQQNDSFVIGEIIYCTGPYYNISTRKKPDHILLMFIFNDTGEIEKVFIRRSMGYPDAPIYH